MRFGGFVAALVFLLACWLAPANPVRAKDKPKSGSEQSAPKDKRGHDAEKHHTPTANEEVGDQDEEWMIFHELDISLPLVGWFKYTLFGKEYSCPTKYEWLILLAAGLVAAIYIPLARRVKSGAPARGPFWNFFEALLTFVRDEVARPNFPEDDHGHHEGHAPESHGAAAGHEHPAEEEPLPQHPADRFVPFLWTLFLFLLFLNLLGMFPFMGSPTANIYVTGGLALLCFLLFHGAPIVKMGPFQYLKALWPKIEVSSPDLSPVGKALVFLPEFVLKLMICLIEFVSTFIKSGVLAIRLFANMFAGHMVLASILLFIVVARNSALWGVITTASVLGVVALSLLELFVGFLQAYIFVFLTALFLGMALHPQH
jgi:F-type H+-transporting ATPase subunit a